MIVLSSGSSYLDIDAYAGCIAYAELLNLQGHEAKAVSSAPLAISITKTLRSLNKRLDSYVPQAEDSFVLIDVSNRTFFDPMVIEENILELIDHHVGFEQYWKQKLGDKADIEFIGAACTQIFERWQRAALSHKMSRASACLLAAGILDNTLNFQAHITSDRDRAAYKHLERIAKLPVDWPLQYFSECQGAIASDLATALRTDCKMMEPTAYLPGVFGQLAVWDARSIMENSKDALVATLQAIDADWVLNLININEGKSYFVAGNKVSQNKIVKLFGCNFANSFADAGRLWLRKEILKEALCREGKI